MKRISILLLVFFTGFVVAAWPQAKAPCKHKPKIITFDVPGAGTGPGQGTFPYGIDSRGTIIGPYVDSGNVNHGFVRTRDGAFTTFDAPGAGIGPGQGTVALSINPSGAVAGMYFDANCLYHGFLRDADGTMTTIDVPGSNTAGGQCSTNIWWLVMQGTAAQNINAAGTISGIYTDAIGVGHIFLRDRDGTFTTFDAPGAGTEAVEGTWTATTYTLNPAGAIAGWYVDSGVVLHGYLRTDKGDVNTFDVPGGGTAPIQGTVATSLNSERAVAGFYLDGNSAFHGFLRSPRGKLTTFDVPGGGAGFFQGTYPVSINPAGAITGNYTDPKNVNHGFVRDLRGKLTTFDIPGAGGGEYQGTIPLGNNPAGAITGNYIDPNGASHGFLRYSDSER